MRADASLGEWRCRCASDPKFDTSVNPRCVAQCLRCGAHRPPKEDASVVPDYIFDVHATHLVCRRSPLPANVGSRFEFHGMGEWFVALSHGGKIVTVQYRDRRQP